MNSKLFELDILSQENHEIFIRRYFVVEKMILHLRKFSKNPFKIFELLKAIKYMKVERLMQKGWVLFNNTKLTKKDLIIYKQEIKTKKVKDILLVKLNK